MSTSQGRGITAIAAATAAVMIAQQVAASSVRDAFFLANYPASALSGAVIVSSVLSVAFLPFLARMMDRFGPAVVIPLTATVSALLLMAEWLISHQRPELAAAALFVHTMVLGSVLVSGYWSLFNESFDPHTAKQLMGRVAGGAALGGIVGGLLVERAGSAGIELPRLLPMLAFVQLLAAGGSRLLNRGPAPTAPAASTDPTPSFSGLMSSQYLRDIALLVGFTAFVSTLTSFLLKAEAASTYLRSAELLRFFARYYLALGLLGFLVQINLTRLSLNRFGLGITIAVLPASLGALALVALAAPTLWSVALLRGADEVLTNSLFRSGYELLYTPIAAGAKRRFKAIVDVGFDRLGKSLGSGLVLLVLWMAPGALARVLLAVAAIGTVATILVAVRLSRGYVTSLKRSLASRAVLLDANALEEAMTLRTIAAGGIDRNELLAAMADRSSGSSEAGSIEFTGGEAGMWGTQTIVVRGPRDRVRASRPAADAGAPAADPLLSDIADLRSGDPQRIRRVLRSSDRIDRHLVPHVVSLLARDDVSNDAVTALRAVADGAAGQLIDTLLDSSTAPIIRRRLPQVLAGNGSGMATAGLLQALDDPEFNVRFRAAGALLRTRETHPDVVMPREAIFEAAMRQIRRGQPLGAHGPDRADPRTLELVFRILSLALEPEPLRLVHQAFEGDDPYLRGTALEYLETVLPARVLQELRPFVGASAPVALRGRTAKELESELLASSAAVAIDVEELRRKLRR
jgi:AAA family ATP:ADP antiporter